MILGAGLDTFAWRRPDLLHDMKVFEIDHPSTQVWKRQRAVKIGLPTHPNHVFTPVDLENTSGREALDAVGFDWTQPGMFSWLAVTMYLTATAIEDTLRAFAACPAGSEIVLTYAPIPQQLDDVRREFVETLAPFAADGGEPIQTTFESGEIEALLERCGLRVVDHPIRDEIRDRYFADRTDGLQPYTCERLVAAQVMG